MIPQGALFNVQGRCKIPDFVVFVCSVDSQVSSEEKKPAITHIGPWWEVKRCLPVSRGQKSPQEPTPFARAFIRGFKQLRDQASFAFDNYPNIMVYRSIFSAGNYFAALEWLRPGKDTAIDGDSKATWLEKETHDLRDMLERAIKRFKKSLLYETFSKDSLKNSDLQEVLNACNSDLATLGQIKCRAIYFGERIFDLSGNQSLKSQSFALTPFFLSALRWVFDMPHLKLAFQDSLFNPPESVKEPSEGSLVRRHSSSSIVISY